jgi:integrase
MGGGGSGDQMLKLVRRGAKGTFQIVGTVRGKRVRESAGTASEQHAQVICARLQSQLLDEATWGKQRTACFYEAVELYLQKGHSKRYVAPLNAHFGKRRMSNITDVDVANFASLQYPNASPQTLDRHVYTPLIAIWRLAHQSKLCGPHEFKRPKKPEAEAVEFATDEYLAQLLPHCSDRLKAAALFLSFTGARGSEACRVTSLDIDWSRRIVTLKKTKNGKPRAIVLAPILVEALLPLRQAIGPLFGLKTYFSLNQALARACRRAGLPVLTSHQVGRHAFAARLLRQGKTLKDIQEAGGWSAASLPLIARIYGHLERKTVDAAILAAGTELTQLVKDRENAVCLQRVARA